MKILKRKGFSLMEMMLVLGAFAAIVAIGFWIYSIASERQRINTAQKQLASIQKGISDMSGIYSDIDEARTMLLSSKTLPSNMISGSTLVNPWKGKITITPHNGSDTFYDVSYYNVPSSSCIDLVNKSRVFYRTVTSTNSSLTSTDNVNGVVDFCSKISKNDAIVFSNFYTGDTVYEASVSNSVSTSTSVSSSTSISASTSASKSISTSASISNSISASTSTSISNSISTSLSTSASISNSISASTSASKSISTSVSNSLSASTSNSISNSISASKSLSTSVSNSISSSASASTSRSISTSVSASTSASLSNSISSSVSASKSASASASLSISASASKVASLSASQSASISASKSASTSASLSASTSLSLSASRSVSTSVSASASLSASRSVSTSVSTSASISRSISTSLANNVNKGNTVVTTATPNITCIIGNGGAMMGKYLCSMTAMSVGGITWKFNYSTFYNAPIKVTNAQISTPNALLNYLNTYKRTSYKLTDFNLTGDAASIYRQILAKFASSVSGTNYVITY